MTGRAAALALFLPALAQAAPIDCIREGGDMECVEPTIANDTVSLCYEGPGFTLYNQFAAACMWGSVTEGTIVQRVNCFEDLVTRCPNGTSTVFPGWRPVGSSSSFSSCYNLTTRVQNGVVLDQWQLLTSATTTRDASDNCTQTGRPFPLSVFVRTNRFLVCPAGYATGTRPNGDLRCFRCPPNSTNLSGQCVCNPGFVKDPRTRQCIPVQCTSDADCANYDNFCNGRTHCAGGVCEQARPPLCVDNRVCTIDSCSNQLNTCEYRFEPLMCTCNPIQPPAITYTLSSGPPWGITANCGLLPGTIGTTVQYGGTGTIKPPTCDNGCEGAGSFEGFLSASGGACTRTVTARGAAKVGGRSRHCPTCDQATCEAGCGVAACQSSSLTGSASLSVTDFAGYRKDFGWGSSYGSSFGVTIKCGGAMTGAIEPTLTRETQSTSATCVGCPPECQRTNLTGVISGDANLGCELSVKGGAKNTSSGAKGAAAGSVKFTFGRIDQSGACGTNTCASLRGDIELGGHAKANFSWGWWTVAGQCTAKTTACVEQNTCGACTCPNCFSTTRDEFSCKVTSGGKF